MACLCPQVYGLYVVKLAVAMVLAGGVQVGAAEDIPQFVSQPLKLFCIHVLVNYSTNRYCQEFNYVIQKETLKHMKVILKPFCHFEHFTWKVSGKSCLKKRAAVLII